MMKHLFYLAVFACIVSCSASKKTSVQVPHDLRVMLTTDSGSMVIRLSDKTPLHRDNFVKLVKEHFFDSLLFHRVIRDFMIQGGDPESKHARQGEQVGEGSLKYSIPAEFDTALFHKKGALAAAREGDADNPTKKSNPSQFYIVQGKTFTNAELDKVEEKMHIKIPENHRVIYRTVGGTPFLDMSYTVFGEVVSGLDVLDKIAKVRTDNNDRPLQNIQMKITMLK
jgi:cyclophilin family peptidyl-prolyl cis-trans isomerase